MSNENKEMPVNLYGILDNELARMHVLMHAFINDNKGSSVDQYGNHNHEVAEIFKRVVTMQDLLLQSLISHDRLLQERIAELALMGKQSESKAP